jgi:hypothetical protein
MRDMRLDHVVYAAEPDGLDATAQRLGETLGGQFVEGGVHPRFGTVNKVLPLAGGHYLEIVCVLDHPAADKVPFGQAIKARTASGGGWVAWCVAVDDLAPHEARLGRPALAGNRHRPDGFELRWRQLGVTDVVIDPQLPFFICWETDPAEHPSKGASGDVDLARMELAGDPHRVSAWLGEPETHPLDDVEVDWLAPHGTPGILAVHFSTPHGLVRV